MQGRTRASIPIIDRYIQPDLLFQVAETGDSSFVTRESGLIYPCGENTKLGTGYIGNNLGSLGGGRKLLQVCFELGGRSIRQCRM